MNDLGERLLVAGLVALVGACSARATPTSVLDTAGSPGNAAGGATSAGGGASVPVSSSTGPNLIVNLDAGAPAPTDPTVKQGVYSLPPDFKKTEHGGYKLGGLLADFVQPDGGTKDCSGQILAEVRDFKRGDQPGGHPDFEMFMGSGEKNLVKPLLASDRTPLLTDGTHISVTSAMTFAQWYHDVPGVNLTYVLYIMAEPNGGVQTFESTSFFPVDGVGWGNQGADHNFGFTTEIHSSFVYKGGETFSFQGDDDLWVFINNRLAIDLGGVHQSQQAQVVLDAQAGALGLVKDQVYNIDLFNAERHSTESNFRMDTDIHFADCGVLAVPPK